MTRATRVGMALFVAAAIAASSGAHAEPAAGARVSAGVDQAAAATGGARVLITLRDPAPSTTGAGDRQTAVSSVQDAVLLSVHAMDLTVTYRYRSTPGLAGIVTGRGLAALRADPNVVAIEIDEPGHGHLRVSVPALRADVVHGDLGLTGHGVTVAILDSGVDLDDPEVTVVAQQCFTHGACQPGNKNTGTNGQDDNGHGTNVAGIIGSDGSAYAPGFAPGSRLVAVKVLDADGAGFVSDWIAGLDWVRTHQGTLHVGVINMSLGTDALYSGSCDAHQTLFSTAVAQLLAMNVVIFASTGNAGSSTTLSAPSCLTGVIAVGATYKANVGRQPPTGNYQGYLGGEFPSCFDATTSLGTITCFTNSSSRLDILAPGAPITAYSPDGGEQPSTYYGTSQASPTAAGVAALMLEANPSLTPTQIAHRLKLSGDTVTDSRNGLQFPRIDALNAVQLATGLAAITVRNASTFSVGQTVNITAGLINPGYPGAADVYVGLLQPDGSIQFYTGNGVVVGNKNDVRTFRTLATGVPLTTPFSVTVPNFYSHQRVAADAKGLYVFFVAAVTTGALSGGTIPGGAILGLRSASFSFP